MNADEIVRALKDESLLAGWPRTCIISKQLCVDAAALIESLQAQLAATQKQLEAAIGDIRLLIDSNAACSLVCNGECGDCMTSATGTARGFKWRGAEGGDK